MKVKNILCLIGGTNMLNTGKIFVKMNVIILYYGNSAEDYEKFLWNSCAYFMKIRKKIWTFVR